MLGKLGKANVQMLDRLTFNIANTEYRAKSTLTARKSSAVPKAVSERFQNIGFLYCCRGKSIVSQSYKRFALSPSPLRGLFVFDARFSTFLEGLGASSYGTLSTTYPFEIHPTARQCSFVA